MDFNYLQRRNIMAPVLPSTGRYSPFDFRQAADAQDQNVTDPLSPPATPPGMSKFSSTYADLADEKGGPAFQKYNDYLNTASPSRDDPQFQPGKMQRLSAILAGVSEGVRHGGGAGYKTSQDILDEPYNQAQQDYKLQGDKLGTAAGIEEKDMGRRVGILKDIIAEQNNRDRLAEETRWHQDTTQTARDRNSRMGFTYRDVTDPKTGIKKTVRIGPDGTTTDFNLGQGALSMPDQIDFAGKKAAAASTATLPDKLKVAGVQAANRLNLQNAKFNSITQLKDHIKNNADKKYEFHADTSSGMLVGVNKSDPNDVITTSVEAGKLSDEDKIALGLKAEKELKGTPKPGTQTEIKRDKNGRPISTSTTPIVNNGPEDLSKLPPPPGGKPGGKWSVLPSGKKVYTEPQ